MKFRRVGGLTIQVPVEVRPDAHRARNARLITFSPAVRESDGREEAPAEVTPSKGEQRDQEKETRTHAAANKHSQRW